MGIHGFYDITLKAAEAIVAKMDVDTGNVASEWNRETPAGIHLVDTIYTQNWVLFGLHMFLAVSREKEDKYGNALIKSLQLLSEIQIESPEIHLHGCWRGMYDRRLREWGGGNRFEGGSHSAYSGWTNAPISIVAALSTQGRNILNH